MRQTTKEAISEAFCALLSKRTIDKITVKDIVAECGVNRQTFYYHFRDIYDLMEWTLAHNIGDFMAQNLTEKAEWQEKIALIFHFFYLNRILILHGYDATNRMQYERTAAKWIAPFIEERIDLYPQAKKVPKEKKEFICRVYTRGYSSLFLEWVEQGMPDENRVNLEDYFTIMEGSVGSALERFQR